MLHEIYLDSYTSNRRNAIAKGDVANYLNADEYPAAGAENTRPIKLPVDRLPEDLCDKMIATIATAGHHNFEAARLLYEALEDLPRAVAASESFWATLCHGPLYRFVQADWPLDARKKSSAENYIAGHYFFGSSGGMWRNALASLWWSVKLTVDKSRGEERKYELSEKFFSNYSLRTTWLTVVLRIQPALHGILEFMVKHPEITTEAQLRYVAKYVNLLGSTKDLSALSKDYVIGQLEMAYDNISNATIDKPSRNGGSADDDKGGFDDDMVNTDIEVCAE